MSNLSGTAEQLRAIRKAQEHFLAMFALECLWEQTRPYELLAQDLAALDGAIDADFSFSGRAGEG